MTKKDISSKEGQNQSSFILPKSEILKKERSFALLFSQGSRIRSGSIHLLYIVQEKPADLDVHFKVGFTAPKRLFRRSPDRNLLKRRMREGFRLNRLALKSYLEENNLMVMMLLIYQNKEIKESNIIHRDIVNGLEELIKRC